MTLPFHLLTITWEYIQNFIFASFILYSSSGEADFIEFLNKEIGRPPIGAVIENIDYVNEMYKHCVFLSANVKYIYKPPTYNGIKNTINNYPDDNISDRYIIEFGSLDTFLAKIERSDTEYLPDSMYAVLINAKSCAPRMGAVYDIANNNGSLLLVKKDGLEVIIFYGALFERMIYIKGSL